MMEKTKDGKGAGLHLDIVIISFINLICGLFGGPWICAATVRAVAHVSALTVFATSHIPGEPNKVFLMLIHCFHSFHRHSMHGEICQLLMP